MAEPRTVRENANALPSEQIATILPHRFRILVTPGDVRTLHGERVEQRGPVGIGKASAYVDGKCAATAELTFVLTEANTGAYGALCAAVAPNTISYIKGRIPSP